MAAKWHCRDWRLLAWIGIKTLSDRVEIENCWSKQERTRKCYQIQSEVTIIESFTYKSNSSITTINGKRCCVLCKVVHVKKDNEKRNLFLLSFKAFKNTTQFFIYNQQHYVQRLQTILPASTSKARKIICRRNFSAIGLVSLFSCGRQLIAKWFFLCSHFL